MASIQQTPSGWRAQLKIAGIRESACFDQRFEAETWAHRREAELKSLRRVASAARRLSTANHKFLSSAAFYGEDEIVGTSTPIPETSGVYFLIKDGRVVYVGKSNNVHRRIQEHLKQKCFDRINVIECPEPELGRIEAHYIRAFRPVLNIAGTAGAGEFEVLVKSMAL